LLAAGIGWAIRYRQGFDVAAVEAVVRCLGAWAPLAYLSPFAIATVLFVPGSLLALAGGALFGLLWGAVYNLLGAMVGATLAFLVARYLASDWMVHRAAMADDKGDTDASAPSAPSAPPGVLTATARFRSMVLPNAFAMRADVE
jgi:uncharacterized membrane protein YdjX (TVP38/TMEM64 family)